MRSGWGAIWLLSCTAVSPHRRAVYVDADPDASAVAQQLEKQLELEGFRIVRGPERADLSLRLDQRSASDRLIAPRDPAAYTLQVVSGAAPGRKFTSQDGACRGAGLAFSECHALDFVRDLREAGELK